MKIPKLGSLITVGCISNQLPRFLADVIGQGRVHAGDEIDFDAVDFVAASMYGSGDGWMDGLLGIVILITQIYSSYNNMLDIV